MAELARLILSEGCRHHYVPESSIFDLHSGFEEMFCAMVMDLPAIAVRRFTLYHPQTDGQIERVNQILEQYLRNFCFYL